MSWSFETDPDFQRELERGMLVIADGPRAIALAGVMGGAETEIGAATRDVLVEAEQAGEQADLRNGCLAYTYRADIVGFDQLDIDQSLKKPRQGGGGHPPGRSATDDDDFADWCNIGINHSGLP